VPNRHGSSSSYRFGFNGQEKDNEIAGVGNHNTALFWEYDTRLGRRWNLDPKPQISISDYAVNYNNPIQHCDPNGDCPLCALGLHSHPVVAGITDGVNASLDKTYQFFSKDAWKASTWKNAGNSLARFVACPEPAVDNTVNNFKKEVVNGNAYSRSKYIAEVGTDILTAYVGSKGLSALKVSSMGMIRGSLASSFYAEAGYTAENALSHMEGINFSKAVQTTTLTKGTVVQQWVGKNGVGSYFTPLENGTAQNLGLADYGKRTLKQFTLTEDVKVLKSTASDLNGAKGGGTQYFSPEIKNKVAPVQ
jgi:hypothetical protein